MLQTDDKAKSGQQIRNYIENHDYYSKDFKPSRDSEFKDDAPEFDIDGIK